MITELFILSYIASTCSKETESNVNILGRASGTCGRSGVYGQNINHVKAMKWKKERALKKLNS